MSPVRWLFAKFAFLGVLVAVVAIPPTVAAAHIVNDIATMRVARRDAILALGLTDRRSAYPLQLLVRAAAAKWRVVEREVTYRPRTGGKSKVSGSVRGSLIAMLDFWRVIS